MPATNVFPMVIKIATDGSNTATIQGFEQFLSSSATRAGQAWERAGQAANSAFKFDNAAREVQKLQRALDNLKLTKNADFLQLDGAFATSLQAPLKRYVDGRLSGEQAIAAVTKSNHAERMHDIQREFDASMAAIRAEQAAENAASNQASANIDRVIASYRQLVAESAKLVAGPQFIQSVAYDPAGAQAAAAAARVFAQQQIALANAAEQAAASTVRATAADITVAQRADQWGGIGPPKSEAGFRTIPISPALVAVLKAWKLRAKPSNLDLAFPNAKGSAQWHQNLLRRMFIPLQVRAGVADPKLDKLGKPILDEEGNAVMAGRYGFHALRHAAASGWIAQRIDLKRLQVWIGHENIQLTIDTYGHLIVDPGGDAELVAAAVADFV